MVPVQDQFPFFDDASEATLQPATPPAEVMALAEALNARFAGRWHLGTSSWHFPGWAGQVWQRPWPAERLSREGLRAYAQHPLLRTVSLDRAFYRPLEVDGYARLAGQVGPDFRFVVKAFAGVTDAMQRDPATGAALQSNPAFLDPEAALLTSLAPAAQGLGDKLGVLVFQLSPLPARWLQAPAELLQRLAALFDALRPHLDGAALLALEVRDPALVNADTARLLKQHGVRWCLGVHDRMPDVAAQLEMLRRTWPGDLVCRWNLQRGQRYAQARDRWAPFDRMQAPDLATRQALARALVGTLGAGHRAFVTINNKAEGSAPASVVALAREMLA